MRPDSAAGIGCFVVDDPSAADAGISVAVISSYSAGIISGFVFLDQGVSGDMELSRVYSAAVIARIVPLYGAAAHVHHGSG